MGVVAPVSGVGAAAGAGRRRRSLAGERPGCLVWVGILAALPGIWLVSREPRHPRRAAPGVGRRRAGRPGLRHALRRAGPDPRGGRLPAAGAQPGRRRRSRSSRWPPPCAGLAAARAARPRSARSAALLGALATGAFLLATHHGCLTVDRGDRLALPGVHGACWRPSCCASTCTAPRRVGLGPVRGRGGPRGRGLTQRPAGDPLDRAPRAPGRTVRLRPGQRVHEGHE